MASFDTKFDHLRIPLIDIQTATNNFPQKNRFRRVEFGSYLFPIQLYEGQLYKGQLLRSGELIDIVARRLDSKDVTHRKTFHMEIMILPSLKHQNIVSIVGFCDEDDEMIIIYKFEAKGSLYQYLSDPVALTWTQRLHICLDIARALGYIHYDKQRSFSVIHRNITSYNILLGNNLEAKLSAFGLAVKQPADRRHGLVFDKVVGTNVYIDPAYEASATVNHKSDVYSLGVVLLEILTGRMAFRAKMGTRMFLPALAKSHYENGTLNDVIHPGLLNQMDPKALKKFSEATYCCLNKQQTQRPNIDRVILALDQVLKLQLAHEQAIPVVQGTSADYWKGKNLKHLKIELDAIKSATENFAEKYFIGSGGYGLVYKAELEHFDSLAMKGNSKSKLPMRCSTVAIKYIINREDTQGEQGFFTEVKTLSSCMHPNIVSLLGFCYERPHMILVYEHVSNGSLDDYLGSEGKMINITCVQRIKICIDIARGLDYIHTTMDNRQKIIHRDIKSANILLGENWEAKIADFGLSVFHPVNHKASTISATKIAGAQVYLDPEYERTHKLKKESDVYSFGVVLFEILCGRLAYDPIYINENEKGLAPIVRQHFEKGTIKEMVDPNLKEENTFTLSKGPNQDSLNTFLTIGNRCLAEKQAERPTMKVVMEELMKALNFQESHKDSLLISLEDIEFATQNFDDKSIIGFQGLEVVYRGEILRANGPTPIAVKRHVEIAERKFVTELEILFEYKHENIIDLVGYCNENDERIIVYEYALNGSLDRHLKNGSLTWRERLKIGIDVAMGLDFLHGGGSTQAPMIHRDIKSSNILLNGDWKAKIKSFGLSMITAGNNEVDFVVDDSPSTPGYCDPLYIERSFLTRESDIYSLGVVLFEMMCGRLAIIEYHEDEPSTLVSSVKQYYKEGKLNELVFKGIKNRVVPKSLTTFLKIAYQCLSYEREERPTAREVALQLKKALEFQEDYEIWEAKLQSDYKEIRQMLKLTDIDSNISKRDLYHMFSKGILLQDGKVVITSIMLMPESFCVSFVSLGNITRFILIIFICFVLCNSACHKAAMEK